MTRPVRPARLALVAAALLAGATACHRAATADGAADRPTDAAAGNRVARLQGSGAPIGVQLWSFREAAKGGTGQMLRMVRGMGLSHVETAGTYGLTAAQFADSLRAAGLRATSMHVSYDELDKNPAKVVADARALGARYVGLAWYPHGQGGFTEADARRAVADFNRFGRAMKDGGLTFFYHNHGYEPVKHGDGTLLDLIIRETDPELVKFEMDVLWTFLPGVDPAALIAKYPGRFRLMHIKDMKPGVPRGSLSGGIPDAQKSVIGQGQVNWPEVLAAARRDGLEYFYLEDETPAPVENAPKSLAYLQAVRF